MFPAGPYTDFIEALQSQYRNGLPGKDGQYPLKPYVGIERKFHPPATPNARKGAVLALFYPVEDVPHLALIQRPDYGGGEIRFDGKLIRKDGLFVPASLHKLNPEHLMGE